MLLLSAQPFKQRSTTWVAVAMNMTLCCSLLSGLLLKFQHNLTPDKAAQVFGNVGPIVLTRILIGANIGVLCLLALLLLCSARSEMRAATLRIRGHGQEPELTLAYGHKWHLFVSHHWDNQDAAATIKRRLQMHLPGVKVFLDVDNLQSIADLEAHVAESAAMLVLLGSPSYFHSMSCLKELTTALAKGTPLIRVHVAELVHDNEPSGKATRPLDELRVHCREHCQHELFDFLFADDWAHRVLSAPPAVPTPFRRMWSNLLAKSSSRSSRSKLGQAINQAVSQAQSSQGKHTQRTDQAHAARPAVISWLRQQHLQQLSVALVAEQLLLCSPAYQTRESLTLDLPGSMLSSPRPLRLHHSVCIWTSRANPTARSVADEWCKWHTSKSQRSTLGRQFSGHATSGRSTKSSSMACTTRQPPSSVRALAAKAGALVDESAPADNEDIDESPPTHMLLHLSAKTWDAEEASLLAEEVLAVLTQHDVHIVLVHECSCDAHGCPFQSIIDMTPSRVKEAGLYAPLALAWHDGPHRQACLHELTRLMANPGLLTQARHSFFKGDILPSLKRAASRAVHRVASTGRMVVGGDAPVQGSTARRPQKHRGRRSLVELMDQDQHA